MKTKSKKESVIYCKYATSDVRNVGRLGIHTVTFFEPSNISVSELKAWRRKSASFRTLSIVDASGTHTTTVTVRLMYLHQSEYHNTIIAVFFTL